MIRRAANAVLTCAALVLPAPSASAQSPDVAPQEEEVGKGGGESVVADTTPLSELVELARKRNPEIRAARHRAEAAGARAPQAGALPDPTLSAGLMNLPVPDMDLSAEGMTMFSFGISQRIPVPGSRGLREAAAAHEHRAALREVEESERQVIARLKRAYHELVFAREAERVLRRNRDLVSNLAEVAGARLAVDGAPQQDVLRAHTEVSRIDEQLVGIENRRTGALTEINAILDREPLDPVEAEYPEAVKRVALGAPAPGAFTSASLDGGVGTDFPSLQALQERAVRARPALAAHEERVEAYRNAREAADRERWPDLGWMAAYSPRSGRRDLVSVGISIDLPLFRGRKQDQAVVEAEAVLADQGARYTGAQAEVRSEVAERYDNLVRVRERILLLDDGVIPQAEATVESAVGAYQAGRMEFAGLLEAQATLFRNEIERARLLADFGAELAALEAAVGGEIEPEEENR